MLLFSACWQIDLACAVTNSARIMRRWVSGTHPPPDDLNQRLIRLIEARIAAMRDMMTRLDTSKEHRN